MIGGPGLIDSSGLEFHYTKTLRPHDAGIMELGLEYTDKLQFHYTKTLRPHDAGIMELGLEYTDKMALPPGLPLWKLIGYCIPECTRVVRDPCRLYALSNVFPSDCLSCLLVSLLIATVVNQGWKEN